MLLTVPGRVFHLSAKIYLWNYFLKNTAVEGRDSLRKEGSYFYQSGLLVMMCSAGLSQQAVFCCTEICLTAAVLFGKNKKGSTRLPFFNR
ncbi:hypothetical protein [Undibacterium sp. WLX3042]|uniref:hypothetical protein n=1 Tax=Undibacterium sp. WLX3042 TaxID=3412686 RepID=UPI003C2F89C5